MLFYDKCRLAGVVVCIVFQCLSIVYSQCSISKINRPNEVYSWFKTVDFVWPNKSFQNEVRRLNRNKLGVPIGIKLYQNRIYLTLPRWSGNANIPANLAWVTRPSTNCTERNPSMLSPKLRPYPSWEMQKIGRCSSFQFVQSMEIDPEGRMWMADNGYVGNTKNPLCPPKLYIIDLKTDKIVKEHIFPRNVVSRNGKSFLNDIVIDPDDEFAFISDSDEGKIVVYSLKDDLSWSIEHSSMKADPRASRFEFVNPSAVITISDNNVNSIALTPLTASSGRYLIFSPLTSLELFAVKANDVKNNQINLNSIRKIADKPSQSDGLAMSLDGDLYFSGVTKNSLYTARLIDRNTNELMSEKIEIKLIAQDNSSLIWPDTFAIDEDGHYLWVTSRGWPIDSRKNSIVQYFIGKRSYLYND